MRFRDGIVTGIVPARFGSSLLTLSHAVPKCQTVHRWWNAAGCDKRLDTCIDRFANFRGEP